MFLKRRRGRITSETATSVQAIIERAVARNTLATLLEIDNDVFLYKYAAIRWRHCARKVHKVA